MTTLTLTVNNRPVTREVAPSTLLIDFLREDLGLTGAHTGCNSTQCGACTVHVDGKAVKSCQTAVSDVDGKSIRTIEGLSPDSSHPLQKAWIAEQVPQCGYCQAGQIMATADLLKRYPKPSDQDIDKNMTNICRCGTYVRIRKAIHRSAELAESGE